MYKIIVCGGRDFDNYDFLFKTLQNLIEELPISYTEVIQIVEGGNKTMRKDGEFMGVDFLAKKFAEAWQFEHKVFVVVALYFITKKNKQ